MYHLDQSGVGIENTATGSFSFGSEPGCIAACDALGDPNHRPDQFCGDGDAFQLDGCPAAKTSYEASTRAWCKNASAPGAFLVQEEKVIANKKVVKHADVHAKTVKMLETTESTPAIANSPPALVASALEAECLAAWKGGCWKKEPFTDCCSCNQAANSEYGCSWAFEFQGETIKQELQYYYGQSCPDVCNTLSHQQAPNMFCDNNAMHAIFEAGGGCPQAQTKWDNMSKPSWCSAPPILAQTQTFGYASLAGAMGLMVALGLVLRLKSRAPADDNYQPFLQ